MDEKLSGSYYTPQKTIHFIYNYLQQQHKPIKSILEPALEMEGSFDFFPNPIL